jgi:hypothetical protein
LCSVILAPLRPVMQPRNPPDRAPEASLQLKLLSAHERVRSVHLDFSKTKRGRSKADPFFKSGHQNPSGVGGPASAPKRHSCRKETKTLTFHFGFRALGAASLDILFFFR